MTQYVHDNDGVAHTFAAGNQEHARSHNGNFYFHGDTLYSYGAHYPVARLDRDAGIAYMNADPSSVTTEGKHKSAARRALRHFERIYLPDLGALCRGKFCTLPRGDLAKYIQRIADDIAALADKRSRMRSEWRMTENEHQQNELRHAAQTVWKLHKRRGDCFSVAAKDTKKERDERIRRDLTAKLATIVARAKRADDVLTELHEPVECRVDAHAYAMRQRQYQATLDALYPCVGFGGAGALVSRKNAVRIMGAEWVRNAEKQRDDLYADMAARIAPVLQTRIDDMQTRIDALLADDIEAWIAGDRDHAPRQMGRVICRVKGDELQTSMGARVPLADAITLTRAAAMCRKAGKPWKRNGDKKPVGQYQTDRITKDGDLIVGCHTIRWNAIVDCVTRFVPELLDVVAS